MTTEIVDPYELEIAEMLADRARTMLEFTADHRPMAIYAIVRKDLEMHAGKMGPQAGHAYAEVIEHTSPELLAQYKGSGHGTKLLAGVKNLGQLKRIYREARAANIPCRLIIDRGHVLLPHFTGEPIVTALGIGPVFKDEVAFITKLITLIK